MNELVSFFLYMSVIITPEGVVKTYTEVMEQCPSMEYVVQSHQKMMANGEILDWRARCNEYEFDMPKPTKGVGT